jgi:6-phosphogluconolactonase (cycloisomerase 2 family)
MKRHRVGMFLTLVVALTSLAVVFVGCDWFKSDSHSSSGNNGPTTSKFVVVANTYGANLSVYKILSDGTLSFVDNVALTSATEPSMVLLAPNELFLYVASHDGYINIFSYNSDNGALTETEGSPVTIGSRPINMAITPDGNFLYLTDQGKSMVHIFGVDNTDGDLTFSESVAVSDVHSIAMHPTGNFVFIGTESDEIWAYAINTDNGSLTAVEGTPYFSDSGATWVWLQTDPEGNYLFATGQDYGAVLAIDNVTGGLTELAFTDTGGFFPKSLVVAPTKPFLYTGNWGDNSIGAFTVDSAGVVDNVAGMPFAAGVTPKSVTITADSKYLYVANYVEDFAVSHKAGAATVMAYNVDQSSGALSHIGTYDLGLGAGPKFLVTLP